ncbi:hypothetical protein ACHAWX_000941, partial [Stephanocyclus meneghinianus]
IEVMSDQHLEEQEMEAEALSAIFDTAFEIRSSSQPFVWAVKLVPVDCGGDEEDEEAANHVMVKLVVNVPLDYPEVSLPVMDLEIIKGLSDDNKRELLAVANNEAEANAGTPSIFAVCEAVRAWLADNNVKGMDDASMHAQMMRKQKEAERREAQAAQQFEAQKKIDEMTEAEKEELAVRKRREEGTPVNDVTFAAWWAKFTLEKELEQSAANDEGGSERAGGKGEVEEKLTGFQIFSEKAGIFSLEKLEAAAEELENDTSALDPEELGDVDEDLFDDDEDLDDLDFDDEDESEEEPEI